MAYLVFKLLEQYMLGIYQTYEFLSKGSKDKKENSVEICDIFNCVFIFLVFFIYRIW